MIADDKPNPFALLGLAAGASDGEIAARAEELSDLAGTEAERSQYRWAREQLMTHPRTRLEWVVFEVPGAVYDDSGWEAFERAHRRSPVDARALASDASPLSVEDFDLAALLGLILDRLLTVPAPDLVAGVAASPVPPGPGSFPVEVRDAIFG